MQMGLVGIWIGMACDECIRTLVFSYTAGTAENGKTGILFDINILSRLGQVMLSI